MTAPTHNPNIAPTIPDPNYLPANNREMDAHQWTLEEGQFTSLVDQLRDNCAQEQTLYAAAQGQYSRLPEPLRSQQIAAQLNEHGIFASRNSIVSRIHEYADRSDTTRVVDLLNTTFGVATVTRGSAAADTARLEAGHQQATVESSLLGTQHDRMKRRHTLQGPPPEMPAAASRRLGELETSLRASRGFRGTLNVPARRVENRERVSLREVRDQYREGQRARTAEQTISLRGLGSAIIAEQDARAAAERARHNRDRNGSFDVILGNITYNIAREQNDRVTRAENLFQAVNNDMNTWFIGDQEARPGQEGNLRAGMHMFAQVIDELSPYDTRRAEALTAFTQLRHRLEARAVAAETASPTGAPRDSIYTPDRGIMTNIGTPDEAVVHEDGSIARLENTAGGGPRTWVRRDSFGREVRNTAPQMTVFEGETGQVNLSHVYEVWETTRTPEAAGRLHAELTHHIGELGQQEGHHVSEIATLGAHVGVEQQIIVEQSRLAATAPTQQERDAARQAQLDATDRLRNLNSERLRHNAELETVREQMHPLVYWNQFLQVNPARANAPRITPEGLVYQNMNMNGLQGSWALRPDGSAVLFDGSRPAGSNYAQHAPDGHRLGYTAAP